MIYPNSSSEKNLTTSFQTFKVSGVTKLLRQAGINKYSGISTYEVFQTLILLIFQGKTFKWRRFLLSLVAKITVNFSNMI